MWRIHMNLYMSTWKNQNMWSSWEGLVPWVMETKIRVRYLCVILFPGDQNPCQLWNINPLMFCSRYHLLQFCFLFHKLHPVHRNNSEEFSNLFSLCFVAGTLSQDEWEVAYLYLAFVLRKVSVTSLLCYDTNVVCPNFPKCHHHSCAWV